MSPVKAALDLVEQIAEPNAHQRVQPRGAPL